MVLQTGRLDLVSLPEEQLRWYLTDPSCLEHMLGLPVSRAILTERVRRAISMKLARMALAPATDHVWQTYWLVVVKAVPLGAGLAGFKGRPDSEGTVEIGYGMDPEFQGRGYTTEAVIGLIDWAFRHPACQTIIAPNTPRSNPASHRVLEKAGMSIYQATPEYQSWRIQRRGLP